MSKATFGNIAYKVEILSTDDLEVCMHNMTRYNHCRLLGHISAQRDLIEAAKLREAELNSSLSTARSLARNQDYLYRELKQERDAALSALEIARATLCELRDYDGWLTKSNEEVVNISTIQSIVDPVLITIGAPSAALAECDRAIREECATLCENTSLPNGENFGEYYASAIREFGLEPKTEDK